MKTSIRWILTEKHNISAMEALNPSWERKEILGRSGEQPIRQRRQFGMPDVLAVSSTSRCLCAASLVATILTVLPASFICPKWIGLLVCDGQSITSLASTDRSKDERGIGDYQIQKFPGTVDKVIASE